MCPQSHSSESWLRKCMLCWWSYAPASCQQIAKYATLRRNRCVKCKSLSTTQASTTSNKTTWRKTSFTTLNTSSCQTARSSLLFSFASHICHFAPMTLDVHLFCLAVLFTLMFILVTSTSTTASICPGHNTQLQQISKVSISLYHAFFNANTSLIKFTFINCTHADISLLFNSLASPRPLVTGLKCCSM